MPRPLSPWIAALPAPAGEPFSWDRAGEVNDGDERADARWLQRFEVGWERRAVPLHQGYALGLVHPDSGDTIVELDEVAMPIQIEQDVLAVLERLERAWPDAAPTAEETLLLATADPTLRYLLVDRLAEVTQPVPAVFHILPWELVERLTDDLIAVLAGATPREVISLGHWFNPAGPAFTAALEQLDEGLREPNAEVARRGATALCSRLLEFRMERLPQQLRARLALLVGVLLEQNPFLGDTARRAQARLLEGGRPYSAPIRHDREVALADDTPPEREVRLAPFTLHLRGLSSDILSIAITARVTAELWEWAMEAYGTMWVPVRVAGASGVTVYYAPLIHSAGELGVLLSIPLGRGGLLEVDFNGPPIGDAEARFLDPEDVRRSMDVLRRRSALRPWQEFAARLRPGHPLGAVIAEASR